MRKRRHDLTPSERAELAAKLALRDSVTTKALMEEFDVSKYVISTIRTEMRRKGKSDGTVRADARIDSCG